MCNAYSLRRSRDELVQLGMAFGQHLGLRLRDEPPEWGPRYRIGPRQRGLILRPEDDDGEAIVWSRALWGLIPPHAKGPSKSLLTNARDDKLISGWPWKLVVRRQRCLVLTDGFFEPEKPARTEGRVPWSYYQLQGGRVFAMAGLFSEAADPKTGEVTDTYTVVTTDASPAIRLHDRMPVILPETDYARWLTPGDVPLDLLRPWPADDMEGWRVTDDARNPRVADRPDLVEPLLS